VLEGGLREPPSSFVQYDLKSSNEPSVWLGSYVSMIVYRLEHRSSKLGPFEHHSSRQKTPSQDVLQYLYTCARSFMPDITELDDVKILMKKHPKAVFGWQSKELCDRMIKDRFAVEKLGFRVVEFDVTPLYISSCGQVVFLPSGYFSH